MAPPSLDGVLNISKPAGWTSHDVVEKLSRSLGAGVAITDAGTIVMPSDVEAALERNVLRVNCVFFVIVELEPRLQGPM